MNSIQSARTTLMSNGLRVNWNNVSSIMYTKENNKYNLEFQWRYKASIRKEKTTLNITPGLEIVKYFSRWNLVPINENILINLNKIMLIEEIETIPGPVDRIRLRIVFVDGFESIINSKSEFWIWWKNNYA
jgi:hypothetical protein